MQEFLAGFTRFKAMAHGKGAISLSAETEMQMHHLAHLSEQHVVDRRYEAMQHMKAEAHSLVMSEDPHLAREADVLSIGGTNATTVHHARQLLQHSLLRSQTSPPRD
jgi:hypothetical protein